MKPCASSNKVQSWESIDWAKARAYVKKLQMRIVKAQKEGHYSKVKSLQWLLTHSFYAKLEYATDTKIIRFKKIVAEANPFDEKWMDYFEEREGEKMLNGTKGREKLLSIWRKQQKCCPVCGDVLNSDTGFRIHIPAGRGARKIMVHPDCHKQIHSLFTSFEPGPA